MIKYFSIFSGIGGFERGIEQTTKKKDFKCIGYSEIDKYAENIYKRHYPNHTGFGDAHKLNTEKLPDVDFLVGGFPCQAFSVAGKKGGFNDSRGTLFFEIARILRDKRPRYFLLENVKGLLYHQKGETFQTILKILASLGYNVQWEIYNSENYGVPQKRERLYIKGSLRTGGGGGLEILPKREKHKTITPINKKKENKDPKMHFFGKNIHYSEVDKNRVCPTTTRGNLFTVTTKQRDTPLSKKQDNYVISFPQIDDDTIMIKNNTKKGYLPAKEGDGVVLDFANARGGVQTQKAPLIMTGGHIGVVTKDLKVRRLTPLECERIQGFPDNWTREGANNELISDTQRYKCLGNAVTTNVVQHIIENWDMY